MAPPEEKRGDDFGSVSLRPAPKGRAVDPHALSEVRAVLGDAPRRRDLLIEYLHRMQDAFGCVSADHLTALAQELSLTMAEVYEVATFYPRFDVVKDGSSAPPAITVHVCDSVPCHLAGADRLLEVLRKASGDGIRVVPTPCVGRCDRAPVAVVGRNAIEHASPATVRDAVNAGRTEATLPPYAGYAAYRAAGGYETLRACRSGQRTVDDVIGAVDASGLRGLGGEGIPTAQKWQIVRAVSGPRIVVINANESEPGAFKDRHCIEADPHRVLEGSLIAAWAVDADDVFIYLRDEYDACRAILTREIAALVADPPCELPRLHLRRGAGAYVCGEESSLIESLEGKRGEPRLRPPLPAQAGVFGRPTLVQNVETLYWLRTLIEEGPTEWRALGRQDHPGARFWSVSGRVKKPGVYLAPNGITARELIDFAGGMMDGHQFNAYLPGGASGGILPDSLADLPLDFSSLDEHGCFVGTAAIVILSRQDSPKDVAQNLMRFFAAESCGKCTPCRVGTAKAATLMRDKEWQGSLLEELDGVMRDASICGLGQSAPNALRSIRKFFSHEMTDLIDLNTLRRR